VDNLGTYVQHQGRPAVRFERRYSHSIEKVWAAISTPEGLRHWFPSDVNIEPYVGGTVAFSGDPHLASMTGTVLMYDPPKALAFTWGGDELHFELEAIDAGTCRLTLVNVLSAENTAARNATGWMVCLAELDKSLEGIASGGPHSGDALEFQPIYDEYVSSGMPFGAEIPDQVG
jgi:uncharacterized protein YndB with AHSA1/START domain